MPSPGTVKNLILPGGPGIRVDTHLYAGYDVPPFYDSLICKVIAWGENRETAIKRMQRALIEFRIDGIHVTVPFHLKLLADPRFARGDIHTHFLDDLTAKPV